MLLALLPIAQGLSKDNSHEASPGSVVLTNGFARAIIDEPNEDGAGVFTIDTGPNHPLPGVDILYGGGSNAWSTYVTVRVENTSREYVTSNDVDISPSTGYTLEVLENYLTSQSLGPNYYALTFTLPEGLVVVQNVSIVGTGLSSGVLVNLTVYNPTAAPYDVKVRFMLDLKIAEEDGAWVSVNGSSWMGNEFEMLNPGPAVILATDSPSNPTIIAQFTLGPLDNPPDRVIYAGWPKLFNNAFLVSVDPSLTVGGGDSAIAFYWETSIIPSGGSLTAASVVTPVPPPAVGGELELASSTGSVGNDSLIYTALAFAVIAALAAVLYRKSSI
ncbi:MAG: hypothetical protein F7C07_00725 [Desulfurococcales archaeon]|nr:hypothetical protein [Desulfurococcales archaeon]